MKGFSKISFSLLFVAFLFAPYALMADIAPLQATGGAVAAKSKHETIRMASEEVTVRLQKASYTVEAVFQMHNSGETTTMRVGFPKGDERINPELGGFPEFTQFHSWLDGKQVQFSKENDCWLAAQVTFPGNATTTVRILYEANYYRGTYASYIVGTGSLWKDSIGKAVFIVDGSAIGGSTGFSAGLNAPNSRRLLTEEALRIEANDYAPDPKAVLGVQISCP